MITTLRHNARAAMKDGMSPVDAIHVAHEMKHGQQVGIPEEEPPGLADGGKLSYEHRKSMKESEFALPGKRQGGKGGYPIPDASHARNALARVAQHGSPSQQREVREKVHKKFPGIK